MIDAVYNQYRWKTFHLGALIFNMVFGIKDRTLGRDTENFDRIVDNPDDLEHWTMSIETAAKIWAMI